MISTLIASKLLKKGGEAYLTYVVNTKTSKPNLIDVPVVCEFPNIFSKELPGLPPDRVIEFGIDLIMGTRLISRHHTEWPDKIKRAQNTVVRVIRQGVY